MTDLDVDRIHVLVVRLQEISAERLKLAQAAVDMGERIVETLDALERELERE